MSVLVNLADFDAHLGASAATYDDTLKQQILDDIEALFEAETGRAPGAFRASGAGRTEVLDGTGSCELFLEYPVAVLTSVKLGYDATAPDETLDVADKRVITFGVGSRQLSRTDGGRFGYVGQSRYVHVTYDFGADLPNTARMAIKSVSALALRRRGSEESSSESIGTVVDRDLVLDLATQDPFWQAAVNANRRLAIA